MKKRLALFVVIIILITMIPMSAFATSHTVGDGEMLDLTTGVLTRADNSTMTLTIADGDTINVAAGAAATITGSTNVQVICGAGVDLTIDGVTIDMSAMSDTCALSFSGGSTEAEHNTLTLVGTSTLTSGENMPGTRVERDTVLTISGSGSVTGKGGQHGAGIGSGRHTHAGTINITGGIVYAVGGNSNMTVTDGVINVSGGHGGAGIGGGTDGDGGAIKINGGVVYAGGGSYAAGIGGGQEGDGGSIWIEGAEVNATGGYEGPGMGGGQYGSVGTVTIHSGVVSATGGEYAAGIGSGCYGDGGGEVSIDSGQVTAQGGQFGAGIGGGYWAQGFGVDIRGGLVFAASDGTWNYDIGPGFCFSGDVGSLNISGDAGVFVYKDCVPPTLSAEHTHFTRTDAIGGKLFGIELPSGWTRAGAYIISTTLRYDANGGEGTPPGDAIVHKGGVPTVAAAGDLSNGRLAMVQWNTDPNAEGYGYYPGVDITLIEDKTLYAIWRDRDVTSVLLDQHSLSLTHYDTDILIAAIDPNNATKHDVVWYSNDTDVAIVDQSGNVTATGVGSTTIVAWADGVRDTCAVTVAKKPVTGVTLSSTTKTMMRGEMDWLSVSVSPSNSTEMDITWTSSNADVVTVSDMGIISAVGAGAATVTATADGESETCTITVQQVVTDVFLSSAAKMLTVGDTENLTATVTPAGAINADVTWTSSDTDVATVNNSGVITAVSEGATVVTAEADGEFDVCAVTVQQPTLTIILKKAAEEMTVGDTTTLSATVTPSDAANASVTWRSTNASVATVDDRGKVTAVSKGVASIIADADGAYDVCSIGVSIAAGDGDDDNSSNDDSQDDDTQDDNTEDDTQEEIPDTSDTGGDTENTVTIVPHTIEETPSDPKVVIVYINVADLPKGTESIQTASGEVIEVGNSDTVLMEIGKDELEAGGTMEIITMNSEGIPLGTLDVQVVEANSVTVSGTGSAWDRIWSVLMWMLIGLAGVAVVAGALVFILRKKKE